MLTPREIICVFIGFLNGRDDLTDEFKNTALSYTADIIKMPEEDVIKVFHECEDGLEQVNKQINKILKQAEAKKRNYGF